MKQDNNLAPYLLDPKDPGYKAPSKKQIADDFDLKPLRRGKIKTKRDRFNPIKAYFQCMLEVILT